MNRKSGLSMLLWSGVDSFFQAYTFGSGTEAAAEGTTPSNARVHAGEMFPARSE